MKIKLSEWGYRNYSPPPSAGELRRWARTGQIHPAPEKVGRILMVDERASRIPLREPTELDNISPRVLHILKTA